MRIKKYTISILLSFIIIFLGSCKKYENKKSNILIGTPKQEMVEIVIIDSSFLHLTFSYSPDYINYRILKKGIRLDSISYVNEFNSLQNLRNYYTYKLQQKYKLHPSVIIEILKKEKPHFFTGVIFSTSFSFEQHNSLINSDYIEMECPTGLLFNSEQLFCDFPENVNGGTSLFCIDINSGEIFECGELWSAPDCRIDNNLSITAGTFIGKCCKASVWSVFPGGQTGTFKDKLVSDIKVNKNADNDYKTAWKLISRQEYRK